MRWFLTTLILLIVIDGVTQGYVHPLARVSDENNYTYFLNIDGKVMPESLPFHKKRVAQRRRSSDPWEVKEYYNNGQLALHTFTSNPDPIYSRFQESYISYFDSGDTCKWIEYRKERKHGAFRTFYANGTLKEACFYKKGRKEGPYVKYDRDGNKLQIGQYENGKHIGKWVTLHSSGDTATIMNYIAGVRIGSNLEMYEDRALKSMKIYNEGELNDTFVSYHPNGEVSQSGRYAQGQPEGKWKTFTESGELIKSVSFKDGEYIGTYFEATDWGDTLAYGEFREQRFFGMQRSYTSDQQLYTQSDLRSGTEVTIRYFDQSGKVVRLGKMGDAGMQYTCPLPGEPGTSCEFSTVKYPQFDGNLQASIANGVAVQFIENYEPRGVYGLTVDREGNTIKTYVIQSANSNFDASVLETLARLRWKPGQFYEQVAEFSTEIAITFKSIDYEFRQGTFYLSDSSIYKEGEVPAIFSDLEQTTRAPKYRGGEDALYEYLAQETRYPASAKESGEKGTSIVGFVVEKSGVVSQPEIILGQHPLFDYEAIRVIENMPLWIAGVKDGKEVSVYYSLPFRFTLK